jgi:predicted TPR repeat methyltransferase
VTALVDLAEVHERAGDRAAAAAGLQRALEVSTQPAATAHARLVRQRLTDLGTDETAEPASSDSRTRLSGPLHVIEIADPDHG